MSAGQALSTVPKPAARGVAAPRNDRSAVLARYVVSETMRVFGLAAAGLAGIIFVGMSVQLVQCGLSVVQLRGIVPFLLLYALPYAVPVGLLIAVSLTFGRLAGDNEINAIRCSGVHLRAIVMPILWLACIITVGALALSLHLLPWANRRVRQLRNLAIQPYLETLGTVRTRLEIMPYELYVSRTDSRGTGWRNVAVVRYVGAYVAEVVIADSGSCTLDERTKKAHVILRKGRIYRPEMRAGGGQRFAEFDEMRVSIDLSRHAAGRLHRPKYKPLWRLLVDRTGLAERLRDRPKVARPAQAKRRLQRKYNRLARAASEQSGRVAAAREKVSSHRAELQRLQARTHAVSEAAKELRRRVDELAREIGRVRVRLAGHRKEAGPRGDDGDILEKNLTRKLADLSTARAQAQANRALRERELAERRRNIAEEKKVMTLAKARLGKAQGRYQALENECRDVGYRLESARWRMEYLECESELHARFSGAIASFVFVLIGLPLGILVRRGNVTVALGISFAVILVLYYPLQATAEMAAENGLVAPGPALWAPNVALGLIGIWLMRKVARV